MRRRLSAKSTRPGSVRNVAIVSLLISAVSALIRRFTANSGVNVSYGKCPESAGSKRTTPGLRLGIVDYGKNENPQSVAGTEIATPNRFHSTHLTIFSRGSLDDLKEVIGLVQSGEPKATLITTSLFAGMFSISRISSS